MRKDMHKVIITRPRAGGDGGKSIPDKGYKKQLQQMGADELPKRESMKTPYRGNRKEFTDLLGPLHRFLRSRCGQPWDKVYSEVCEHVNLNNNVQKHLLTHLDLYVEKNAKIVDGKLLLTSEGHSLASEFYVHPKTGLLTENKEYRSQFFNWGGYKKPKLMVPHEKNENIQYHKINGVWYEVEIESLSDVSSWFVGDVILTDFVCVNGWEKRNTLYSTYGKLAHSVSKRQLNSREIKKLKLNEKLAG